MADSVEGPAPPNPVLTPSELLKQMSERIADPERLRVITELGLHGHDEDVHLDGVLRTLAAACSVPIVALNIVTPGRQTFASEIGIGRAFAEDDDELSFCASVIATGRPLTVSDAAHHAVLCRCPLVEAGTVGSYAGEPVAHRGVVVGALGMYDARARIFTEAEQTVLHELARLVEMMLANRYDAHTTHATMLRSLIDRSDSLIYVKDLEGRYLLANPHMAAVFSTSEKNLLGRTDAYLDPEQAEIWQANDARALVGDYDRVEHVDLPDGRHTYESTKFPLIDGAGQVYALGGVSRDVTENLQSASDLAAARDAAMEASRQKSAFLATMSHEIRTPMNAVIGMTGLLLGTELDEAQREFVETVASSGEALLAIITNILDFSKIEAGGLTLENAPFDLRGCVESALDLVAAGTSRDAPELIGDVGEGCPDRVVGDVTRLGQVLVNLLGNAVKFTPHGEVVLTAEPAAMHGGGSGLRFTVTDSGIGIPPARLASLFDSFSQVDTSTTRVYGGTGLGLAISHRLVHAMGGNLTVTSTTGTGSSFTFTVPLPPAPAEAEAEAAAGAGPAAGAVRAPEPGNADPFDSLRGRAALVVDDNAVNRRILRHQLQSWGLTVTEAPNADAATALLAAGSRVDIALLDMTMPTTTGYDLAVAVRAEPSTATLPMILLDSLSDRHEHPTPGLFAAVLTKPVRATVLRSSLQRVLTTHPVRPPEVGPPYGTGELPATPARALRVLLAEDNAVNQRLGRLLLEKLGHRVDVVANGVDAVRAAHTRPYDAILMDVEMPVLDGLEATRRIRADPTHPRPHIIAMTASVLTETRDACHAAGMDDFLPKPVRIHDLATTLARSGDLESEPDGSHIPLGIASGS